MNFSKKNHEILKQNKIGVSKKIIAILIITFTSFNNYAQDPQLLDNTWYLQKVNYEGEDFFPPSSGFITELYFYLDTFNYIYTFCNFGWSSDINYDSNNSEFILGNEFIGLGDGCNDPDLIDFMNLHNSIYYINNSIPLNPFTYIITPSSNYLQLTITNVNGDIAIYGNELLSNQDFDNLSFNIFPNPVYDILHILEPNSVKINYIKVYDILGKLVLEENNNLNQINMSNLNSGFFFIQLETNKGIFTQKIIKE